MKPYATGYALIYFSHSSKLSVLYFVRMAFATPNAVHRELGDPAFLLKAEVEVTLRLKLSQYVLLSSPLWNFRPDISSTSCRNVTASDFDSDRATKV
jgi:hypothetical protein